MMKKLEWILDYYLVYLLYNEKKLHHYNQYMTKKWGSKYTETLTDEVTR